jgi:hypothetical protein
MIEKTKVETPAENGCCSTGEAKQILFAPRGCTVAAIGARRARAGCMGGTTLCTPAGSMTFS